MKTKHFFIFPGQSFSEHSPTMFCKKAVLENLAKITGRHLYWCLCLVSKLAALKMTLTGHCPVNFATFFHNSLLEEKMWTCNYDIITFTNLKQ